MHVRIPDIARTRIWSHHSFSSPSLQLKVAVLVAWSNRPADAYVMRFSQMSQTPALVSGADQGSGHNPRPRIVALRQGIRLDYRRHLSGGRAPTQGGDHHDQTIISGLIARPARRRDAHVSFRPELQDRTHMAAQSAA